MEYKRMNTRILISVLCVAAGAASATGQESTRSISAKEFQSPPAELSAFWFWNGDLAVDFTGMLLRVFITDLAYNTFLPGNFAEGQLEAFNSSEDRLKATSNLYYTSAGFLGAGVSLPSTRIHSVGGSSGFPSLGSWATGSFGTGSNKDSGVNIGSLVNSTGWIQVHWNETTATPLNLALQPSGGRVSVGLGAETIDGKFHVKATSAENIPVAVQHQLNNTKPFGDFQSAEGLNTSNPISQWTHGSGGIQKYKKDTLNGSTYWFPAHSAPLFKSTIPTLPIPSVRMTASITSATGDSQGSTVYIHSFGGSDIPLYYSSEWRVFPAPATPLSLTLPAGTFQAHDIYLYWDNSAKAIKIESVAWSNATTPPTRVKLTGTSGGIMTKNGDQTRLFIGAICTGPNSGQTNDVQAFRLISNYYHPLPAAIFVILVGSAYTYQSTVGREFNGLSGVNRAALFNCEADRPQGNMHVGVWMNHGTGNAYSLAIHSSQLGGTLPGHPFRYRQGGPAEVGTISPWLPYVGLEYLTAWESCDNSAVLVTIDGNGHLNGAGMF